jgi:hypothetical protein
MIIAMSALAMSQALTSTTMTLVPDAIAATSMLTNSKNQAALGTSKFAQSAFTNKPQSSTSTSKNPRICMVRHLLPPKASASAREPLHPAAAAMASISAGVFKL